MNHLPAGYVYSTAEREFLKFDEQTIKEHIAQRQPFVMAQCKEAIPTADDAYCARVFAADARIMPKFVDTRQRFLRGELDTADFQALWHAHFLERQIALEQFMSYDDKLRYDGTPPGDDNFLVLTVWGMYPPDGHTLALDEPPDWQSPDPATTEAERGFTPAPMTEKPQ